MGTFPGVTESQVTVSFALLENYFFIEDPLVCIKPHVNLVLNVGFPAFRRDSEQLKGDQDDIQGIIL